MGTLWVEKSAVSDGRTRALEQMGAAIKERDNLTAMGEQAMSRMERGNKAAVTLNLDQDLTATGNKNN